jgi:hypothetical protein
MTGPKALSDYFGAWHGSHFFLAVPRQYVWLIICIRALVLEGAHCPEANRGARSIDSTLSGKFQIDIRNDAGVKLEVFWVDFNGEEVFIGKILENDVFEQTSFAGHLFNIYATGSHATVAVHLVGMAELVVVKKCDGMGPAQLDSSRWSEFELLVHDQAAPCVGLSKDWSCVRTVSPQELASRDYDKFGFHQNELSKDGYRIGQTTDTKFIRQQSLMVNVTDYSVGYLKMNMTKHMQDLLYPWYELKRRTSVHTHEVIPGGFTNNHVIPMDMITMDIREKFASEMHAVLTWWTRLQLKHSSTYGVRIYRRGSMLINHLDRPDTHVASAVIQVGQRVDVGWPLEVVHPHCAGLKEVYLQPGEMVLYEGARLQHGRPMRFQGEEFANIFSHFVPTSWRGMDSASVNPHYVSKPILMDPNQPFGSTPDESSEL